MLLIVLLIAAGLMSWWGKSRKLTPPWLVWLPFSAPAAGGVALIVTLRGLWRSFEAVESGDPSTKASRLAQGISESMSATAYGIGFALLMLIACGIVFARAPRR